MTDIRRQSTAARRYHEWGPYVTNGTVTGVDWQFTAVEDQPSDLDWVAGTVDVDPDDDTRYNLRILVSGVSPGGGTVELDVGSYRLWVRPTASPEADAFPVGTLIMY